MWKDATNYSQGERAKGLPPSAFSTTSGKLDIYITCKHLHDPGNWVMHCRRLSINTLRLDAKTVDEAKKAAIAVIVNLVATLEKDASGFSA